MRSANPPLRRKYEQDRKPKLGAFGLQLREKQKARRYYQLLEGQFRNLFEKASIMKGITGDTMLMPTLAVWLRTT